MANIAPANFAYVNANGDKGDVQVLSDADITLLNKGLQDIEDLKLAIQKPLPAGTMIPFAGNVVPEGFLICNGAAVSRTDYANLFAAIGTLYGAGDGSTTFNLPDARDRVLQGSSSTHAAGSYIAAGLPNVTGGVGYLLSWESTVPLPISRTGLSWAQPYPKHAVTAATQSGNYSYTDLSLNLARDNSIYGSSSTVQPLAIVTQYLIRY